MPQLPRQWVAPNGVTGESSLIGPSEKLTLQLKRSDLVLINCDPNLVYRISTLFLLRRKLRRPMVAVDLVLRKPSNIIGSVKTLVRRGLLSQVDWFLHYFRDWSGYTQYFGIGPERSDYVPFKPNLRYQIDPNANPAGEYVLCFGRSMRDYETFFNAVVHLPYPAAIPRPDIKALRDHGSRLTRSLAEIPKTVRLLDDDGGRDDQVQILHKARLVVLPILKSSIAASGIGTYLNAMLMAKCVILTEGPGASDVLKNEAIFVPPENPVALARAIQRTWENPDLLERTAWAGHEYALRLGGEADSTTRILEKVAERYGNRIRVGAHRY